MLKSIIKKLKKYLISLGLCKIKKDQESEIPFSIEDSERIVRVIFFPAHLTKKDHSIKTIAFRSPAGKDEVSVIRLEYCSPEFCKHHGKINQNPSQKRSYYGFAVLIANEIRQVDADIVYTPEGNHKFHADIKVGYISIKGEELPARIKYKVETMARTARLYKDPNPNSETWNGSNLE